MLRQASLLAFVMALVAAPSASALCIYKGKMSAKTTLAQEFQDSRWVVRAKLIAADDHWPDEDESWTLYHVQVLTVYKGKPPLRIDIFTYRDSGGFYLDKGVYNNLGGEYLLFLDPYGRADQVPLQARHAMAVNYNCGQSGEWSRVTHSQQQLLKTLAGDRLIEYRDPLPTDERLLPHSLESQALRLR